MTSQQPPRLIHQLQSPSGGLPVCRAVHWPKAIERKGLSLFEVVLALAILAMATAYLAQLMFTSTEGALRAEKLTQAELVAENVMNQVVAGVIPAQPTTWTNYQSPNVMGSASLMNTSGGVSTTGGQAQWMYQVQLVPAEIENMIGVQVAVKRVEPNGAEVTYDLQINRWMIDPALGLDAPPEEEDAESDTSSAASGGSSSGL